ncbi:hypothetical protein BJX65DRAFT_303833 [Aspergillus insuetus]
MAVSHDARCAALSWAHTHCQHNQCQRDSMEDGYRIGNSKEKIKMENSQLVRYPGSFFRPINHELDVHFFPKDLPDFLNWHAQCRLRLRVESDMLLRQRAKRQAPGSASLCPSLPGPEQAQEPEVLLRAPFNSLPSDRRIKHVAISAGHLAPCLDDAGLAELWKMFRMEVLFVILPLSDDDGPWCYRTVWRYGLGDPSSVPLPPYRLGCGVLRWFQGQDQEDSRSQPQPQPQTQSQSYFPTRSVSDTSEKKKEQKQGVVATSVWNPETRQFSWWGNDGPGVDYNARIAARSLFLQSQKLAETLVLAEVKRFEVRYVY